MAPTTTTVRVEYSEVCQKEAAAGRSPWGFTRTIDEVAPALDGRLLLYGEHEDEAEVRQRLADVRELLLDPGRRSTAWVRGADGDFVRVPAREAPLVVRCDVLPEAQLDRAAFGWTWRGLHAAEGLLGPEQLGVELRTPAAIPDDATELWWGAAIGPPENSFALGGTVPYAHELEALTIR